MIINTTAQLLVCDQELFGMGTAEGSTHLSGTVATQPTSPMSGSYPCYSSLALIRAELHLQA